MQALIALSRFIGNTFAVWVLLFAVMAFFQPSWFLPLTAWIVPLLGLIMFGMGLTLKGADFQEVARRSPHHHQAAEQLAKAIKDDQKRPAHAR